jgi:hypothetical protein
MLSMPVIIFQQLPRLPCLSSAFKQCHDIRSCQNQLLPKNKQEDWDLEGDSHERVDLPDRDTYAFILFNVIERLYS